ncbi:hemolysin family protein [Actinomycetota bacterium]
MTGQLVLAALLSVMVAAILAGSEAALQRISRVRAEELADDQRSGSRSLTTIVSDPAPYLAVAAFLRALAEAGAAVFITLAVVAEVDGFARTLLYAVGIMTLVSFLVVGVSPRTLGRQRSDAIALATAPLVVGLRRVLGPVARLLIAIGNAATPGRGFRDGPFDSEAELRGLVDFASESQLIEDDEREMIHSVFELGDTLVREVMVPRTDMVVIQAEKSLRSAMSLFLRSGFSRIPVTGESTDDIQGLLYFKDVARRLNADPDAVTIEVGHVMRPMPFVPESKPVDDLLREMQRDQTHLACVIDEYGGTAGLVTIEDVLEEIVGEIVDEYDREEEESEELAADRWRVAASMDIDDLADLCGVEIEEDEVDTVGGLMAKAIGRVPILGSRCEVAGLSLTAEKMGGRRHRVATVLVERVAGNDDDSSTHQRGSHDDEH